MIFIGYQGIGKSTFSAGRPEYIDLESSSFWCNGKRPDDWYIYYCQVAEDLSRQGYKVFVSSHEVVRNFLKVSKEEVEIICPAPDLKDEWCAKLKARYDENPSEKNYKAWKNAEDRFVDNIDELINSRITFRLITKMDYDLADYV